MTTIGADRWMSVHDLAGRPSPQDCDAAQDMLGGSVAVYLDAAPTAAAVPSSIVELTGDVPVRLHAGGAVGADRLRELLPDLAER